MKGRKYEQFFCDISKAFDRVWHRGLIHKLRLTGINGSLLDWFCDYLSERKQRVVLSGSFSDTLPINAGVSHKARSLVPYSSLYTLLTLSKI